MIKRPGTKNAFGLLIGLVVIITVIFTVINISAVSIGTGITPDITTEEFPPKVWFCGERVVYDDNTEPGRVSLGGSPLVERFHNYAFEGEQIKWDVLVFDKNGIGTLEDVFITIGDVQGEGNDIEVDCKKISGYAIPGAQIRDTCNARNLEQEITQFDPDIMGYYECTLTVETPESMYGDYWITVEANDRDGLSETMDENEYWFFNPIIALSIEGDMLFEEVRPGTSSYSETILVGNDADYGSGVMLDTFMSGTDFYDSSSSGATCPYTNQLSLTNFRYYAAKGGYSTRYDLGIGRGERKRDSEGYLGIGYSNKFNPGQFYDGYEIIQDQKLNSYYYANLLSPGSEFSITFRLDLPEPCDGDFDSGSIYFWGEAV